MVVGREDAHDECLHSEALWARLHSHLQVVVKKSIHSVVILKYSCVESCATIGSLVAPNYVRCKTFLGMGHAISSLTKLLGLTSPTTACSKRVNTRWLWR